MKSKLLSILAESRERAINQKNQLEQTLALIDYEIECVTNSINPKND